MSFEKRLWSVWLVVLCSVSRPACSQGFGPVRIESENFPGLKIGFEDYEMTPIRKERFLTELDQTGRRFHLRSPGLTGEANTFSFESADFAAYHLKAENDYIYIVELTEDAPQSDKENATFRVSCSVWEKLDGYCAITMAAYSDRYIRHQGGVIRVAPYEDQELFRRDASFRAVDGPYLLQSFNQPSEKIECDENRECYISNVGYFFYLCHPALAGAANEDSAYVSAESKTFSGSHLRIHADKVDLEARDDPRDPEHYAAGASFIIHQDKWVEGYIALESVQVPDYFIRHQRERRLVLGTDSGDTPDQFFREDASFRPVLGPLYLEPLDYPGYKMSFGDGNIATLSLNGHSFHMLFPGLSGQEGTVSLESSSLSGYFLSQQHERTLKLESKQDTGNPNGFEEGCSFILRESVWFEHSVCFESSLLPGHWITRNEFKVELLPFESSAEFQQAATFTGPSLLQSVNSPEHKVGFSMEGLAGLHHRGRRFFLHSPGLTGQDGTVSLESADRPHYFMRHYDSKLDVEPRGTGRNPDIFNKDATFYIRKNNVPGYFMFESVNFPNMFISHTPGHRLVLANNDSTEDFNRNATWRFIQGPYFLQSEEAPESKIAADKDYKAVITREGNLTYVTRPSLRGGNETVSLELLELPGFHMRQDNNALRFETKGTPTRPEDFLDDCSFAVTTKCLGSQGHCFFLESIVQPGLFVTREQEELIMKSGNSEAAKFRAIQGPLFLECYNYPGFYITHRDEDETTINLYLDQSAQKFHMTYPGLSGEDGSVSLQSVLNPSYYILQVEGQYLVLADRKAGDESFDGDATFYLREEPWLEHTIALEAVNRPNTYVIHNGIQLQLRTEERTRDFRYHASFNRILAMEDQLSFTTIGPYLIQTTYNPQYNMGFDAVWMLVPHTKGRRFQLLTPGLTGQNNTVSLESVDEPGFFVRHYAMALNVESRYDPRNPHLYKEDATFYFRRYSECKECFRLESVNLLQHFVAFNPDGYSLQEESAKSIDPLTVFRAIEGPYYLQPYSKEQYTVGFDERGQGALLSRGSLVYIVQPGLSGTEGTSSIQPVNKPHYHMYDAGDYLGIMDRTEPNDPEGLDGDATFLIRWNAWVKGALSMESINRNAYYVSHKDTLKLRLLQYDGTKEFQIDATFRTIQGPLFLESVRFQGYKISVNPETRRATINETGSDFRLVYPGRSGDVGTVSLEMATLPGMYLRHKSSFIHLENSSNPSDPESFEQDATFILREDVWFENSISLESVNHAGLYVMQSDYQLKVQLLQDAPDTFTEDASFRVLDGEDMQPSDNESNSKHTTIVITCSVIGGLLGLFLIVFITERYRSKFFKQREAMGKEGIENPTYDDSVKYNAEGGVDLGNNDAPTSMSRQNSRSSTSMSRQNSRSSTSSRNKIQLPEHFEINFESALDDAGQGTEDTRVGVVNPMYDASKLAFMAPFASVGSLEASGLPEDSLDNEFLKSGLKSPTSYPGADPLKRSDSTP